MDKDELIKKYKETMKLKEEYLSGSRLCSGDSLKTYLYIIGLNNVENKLDAIREQLETRGFSEKEEYSRIISIENGI